MSQLCATLFRLALFPMLVLFVVVFWNVLNRISYCSGLLKFLTALCLSMVCLVALHGMTVEKSSLDAEVTQQQQLEVHMLKSEQHAEDFLGSMYLVIWTILILIGLMLFIIADNALTIEMINNFIKPSRKPLPGQN